MVERGAHGGATSANVSTRTPYAPKPAATRSKSVSDSPLMTSVSGPYMSCWPCSDMAQDSLLTTIVTIGSPWRTIVSNSWMWKPAPPSPISNTTRRAGSAICAPIARPGVVPRRPM